MPAKESRQAALLNREGIGSIVPFGGTLAGGAVGFIGGALIGKSGGERVEEELITEELGDANYAAANFFLDYDADKMRAL